MSSVLKPWTMLRGMITTVTMPIQIIARVVKKSSKLKIPPWVRYSLHFFALALLIGVLVYLNLRLEWYLHLPDAPNVVKYTWPALIALLIYAAVRLILYIIAQIPTAETEFADIEDAVEAGLAAIAGAQISIRDTPAFIVVGMTNQEERSFLESNLVGKDIRVDDPRLPVHWFGDAKAIWITLPGVSAVVAQSSAGGATSAEPADQGPDLSATLGGVDAGRFNTLVGNAGKFATYIGSAPDREAAAPKVPHAYHAPARRLSADDRDKCEARLRFFCRLLKDARYPVCTSNGLLLTVPYAWTTSPGLAQLADTVKIDMQALQQHLGTRGLCVLAFTGIEQFPEFQTYIDRIDREQAERRCGCSFPSLITPSSQDAESAHQWIVSYFERQVFELFQRKLGDPTNGNLFRLLDRIRKAKPHLVRILNNLFPEEVKEPLYLGGVYFASMTGRPDVKLPFFEGLLARLMREHDDVIGWSDQSLNEDRSMVSWSRWILIATAGLVILDALLVLSLFLPTSGS